MKLFKYNLIVFAALSLALFTSCKKDKPSGGTPDGKGFTAMTEQDGGNSKTHLDEANVCWTAGDEIKVASEDHFSTQQYTFELTDGAGNTSGVFYTGDDYADGFFDEGTHYVAIYPATNRDDDDNSITSATASAVEASFKLPAIQDYKEGSFGEKASPMMAHSTDRKLRFKNVMGGVCFLLHGDAIVTKVVLTSKKTDEALWGTCTATLGGIDGASSFAANAISTANSAADKNVVTLDCGAGITISSNPASPTKFYIMLPPGTLGSGFTMEVKGKDAEGGTERVLYKHDGGIAKGTITRNSILRATSSVYLKKGAIDAAFTVGMDGSTPRKVYFSKGNLQYMGSAGDGTVSNTGAYWKFADNQLDYFGTTTGQNSSSKIVDRDLFGWGTSGYHDGEDVENIYYNPYSTEMSYDETSRPNNPSGYGPSSNQLNPDIAVSNYDWGVYNSISNGGSLQGQWRTLTYDEWNYLLFTRGGDGYPRYVKATVNSKYGLILFPDNYPDSAPATVNTPTTYYNVNSYEGDDWTAMENEGCVFLPAAGIRAETSVDYVGPSMDQFSGYYWSSTHTENNNYAFRLFFTNTNLYTVSNAPGRHLGFSIRLVRDVN